MKVVLLTIKLTYSIKLSWGMIKRLKMNKEHKSTRRETLAIEIFAWYLNLCDSSLWGVLLTEHRVFVLHPHSLKLEELVNVPLEQHIRLKIESILSQSKLRLVPNQYC